MDFLPGAGSKKVSLGGRSRRDVRSREEVLKEAKARREAAQRQSAPGKKATIIQRYARRLFAQRRAAILLRALMTDKLMSVASTTDAAVAESQHNPQFTPLAARQLGMLWQFTSRRAGTAELDMLTALVDAFARYTLQVKADGSQGSSALYIVDGDRSSGGRGWLRRYARLLPALVETVVRGSSASAALLVALCATAPYPMDGIVPASPPVYDDLHTRLARELRACGAQVMLHGLGRLFQGSTAQPSTTMGGDDCSDRLNALLSIVRDVFSASASAISGTPLVPLAQGLAAHVPPELLLVKPPPFSIRPMVRQFFQDLFGNPTIRRAIEEAYAAELVRRTQSSTIAGDFDAQPQDFSSMCYEALLSCLQGNGFDWRRGGWEEGHSRSLSPPELSSLMSAHVGRLLSAAPSVGVDAVGGGEALMLLMCANWDVGRAVMDAAATQRGQQDGAALAPPTLDLTSSQPLIDHQAVSTDQMEVDNGDENGGEERTGRDDVKEDVIPQSNASASGTIGHALETTAPSTPATCGICFEESDPIGSLRALSCGHGFCDDCWGGTLTAALERGPACIHDKCPQPGCNVRISGDVWSATLPSGAAQRLQEIAMRSFVEGNSLLARCPSATCGKVAAHTNPAVPPEVHGCACGASFCILCGDPPHWPLSCARKARFYELLNQNPDAMAIMRLTRPCPTCGVRTQRSHGCMHITCTQCASEWCWGCGQTGKKGAVHHVHACNRRPDPSWSFEAEDKRALDGSMAARVDEWLYRKEQIDLILKKGAVSAAALAKEMLEAEQRGGTASDAPSSHTASAFASAQGPSLQSLTPGMLRPALLRSLAILRWLQIYYHFAPLATLPTRARMAVNCLGSATDKLFSACDFEGVLGGPNWGYLNSEEASTQRALVVCCLFYLTSHLPPGPA